MKIPKSINLFGRTIRVIADSTLNQNDDCVGIARYRTDEIRLLPNTNGFSRTRGQIEQTFLHEVLHWAFHLLGEHELRDNEKMVDALAGMLHQSSNSGIGEVSDEELGSPYA